MNLPRILLIIAILLLGVYLYPVQKKDFAELSGNLPPAQRQSLLAFRQTHPPQSLTVDGQDWEYVAFGAGDEAIIFLHGMTGAYDIWWQQMSELAQAYRVVSLTYPATDTLESLSRGVLAIMDAEGIPRAHFIGSSLGGYLLQYLILTHPERVQSAVLSNTFPPNDLQREKNLPLIRAVPFLPNWFVMSFFRNSIEKNIYPASGYSELVLAYMLEQVSGRMSKAQVSARAKAVIEPFTPPDTAGAGLPLMIIESDNDPLVEPELRQALKATYPDAVVHTLNGAGHFPYLNMAETYTRLLKAFLTP